MHRFHAMWSWAKAQPIKGLQSGEGMAVHEGVQVQGWGIHRFYAMGWWVNQRKGRRIKAPQSGAQTGVENKVAITLCNFYFIVWQNFEWPYSLGDVLLNMKSLLFLL